MATNSTTLEALRVRISYTGNPEHKSNPGNFGLSPPSSPRADKTLCDGVPEVDLARATQLLQEGVRRGLVSLQERAGLPQQVWAVSDSGVALEAQLENQNLATYHGYPMQSSDPLRNEIVRLWNERA